MDETKERFRRMVDLSPEGILITHDLRVVFANAAAARLFGASAPDHLVNSAFLNLLHPGSRAPLREQLGRLRSGRTLAPTDERILRVDGKALSVEITAAALDDRNVPEIQVILRDASERKRAERALRESEERLTLAFAGAQEGVWDWNLETGAVVLLRAVEGDARLRGRRDRAARQRLGAAAASRRPAARRSRCTTSVTRGGAELRRGVPPSPQGRPLRPRALARLSGPARARRAGRAHRRHPFRSDRAPARRSGAARERGAADAGVRRRAGRRLGLEPRNRRGRVLAAVEADARLRGRRIEPHISAWERLLHPDDMRARAAGQRKRRRAASGPTKESSASATRTATTSTSSRAAFRCAASPAGRWCASSARTSISPNASRPRSAAPAHEELETGRERTAELARPTPLREEMGERSARTGPHRAAGRLVFAQEDERRRIAREMHDQFGEQLTALGRGIGVLKDACANRPTLRGARRRAREDRPADRPRRRSSRLGAAADRARRSRPARRARRTTCRTGRSASASPAELHTSGLLDDRLSSEVETTLYRIAQEALTNVAKHAQARTRRVILERRADHVLLIVEDDGVGFDHGRARARRRQGFGLLGMQERAALVGATLEIESATGQGHDHPGADGDCRHRTAAVDHA